MTGVPWWQRMGSQGDKGPKGRPRLQNPLTPAERQQRRRDRLSPSERRWVQCIDNARRKRKKAKRRMETKRRGTKAPRDLAVGAALVFRNRACLVVHKRKAGAEEWVVLRDAKTYKEIALPLSSVN